jgi:cytochrome d ubiquinol oxidase subunit I
MLASLVGWVFTEMGRQPWLVFGVMTTESGVSPGVPAWAVLVSLAVFTLVYGALAVVEFKLIVRAVQAGPPAIDASGDGDGEGDVDHKQLATVY